MIQVGKRNKENFHVQISKNKIRQQMEKNPQLKCFKDTFISTYSMFPKQQGGLLIIKLEVVEQKHPSLIVERNIQPTTCLNTENK